MAREIGSVGVIGLGTMGAGIAEVFARGGLRVVGLEGSAELAERGEGILRSSTDRAVARGRLDGAGRAELLGRVQVTTEIADLADVDLVVEAVPEVLDLKHEVFARVEEVVGPDCVLASNTSSLSITAIAARTSRPERVVGMHFFNPAPVLRLVEVITTLRTDPDVTDAVAALAERLGKKPVVVGDRAGFVANYLLFGYLSTALRMIEHRHVELADLDTAMRVGAGLPMGPATLMDLIGLDVCDHIGEVIYGHSRSPLHAPSTMLQQLVSAGRLGRKSGQGFYPYPSPEDPPEATTSDVGEVGVLGAGAAATAVVERLHDAGVAVRHVPDVGGDLAGLADVSVVVVDDEPGEAEPADRGELAQALGHACGLRTVLAWSDAAGSAAGLGAASGAPERTVSLQVHTPTPHGQVVEIGRHVATSDETVERVRQVVVAAGAAPVVCRDRVGLVVDALLVGLLADCVRMVDEGYASVSDVDTALQFGLGFPVGPFALIDELGADEVYAVAEELHLQGGDPPGTALPPPPLLLEHALLDRPFLPPG